MKRLVMTVVAVGAALAAAAMPTKKELQKAQEMVADVTEADVKALKSGAKKPAEVAAKHMELAAQAGSEAEKYLLLQGAFKLYAKAGDYDAAADALGTMNREIADMNPEVIVDIYNKAIFRSMKEKAPKLHAIKEAARRQVTYRKLLAKAEAAVKANPKDPAAQKKLGECHAELGNWPKALDAFALAGGALAKTAAAEKDGTAAPQVSGDFWWDYESGDEMSAYKLHAAELYRTALADDSFKGLARTRADQRVKEAEASGIDLPAATSVAQTRNAGLRASAPKNVANRTFDLGCERKLEMIACPAGTFTMGEKTVAGDCNEVRKHQVKITRPFWLSKVAVTVSQWAKIIDEKNVGEKEDFRYDFPKGNTPLYDKLKFIEKLNRVFASELPEGYVFRLPTEAELAYAMTSGGRDKVTELSIGVLGPSKADKEKIAKGMAAKGATLKNWPYMITQTKAGLAKPNKWGFYDIINNGEQLVLDRIAPNSKMRKLKCGEKNSIVNIEYESVETDPLCWEDDEKDAKSLCVDQANFWGRNMCGTWGWIETFRVCLGPDLIAEKKAKSGGVGKTMLNGGSSIAPAKAASAASAKPMSLELAKGINLELMPCPAGEFDMERGGLKDVKGLYPHRVKISRPFWLSKNRVTIEQYETFKKATRIREKKGPALEVLGGEKCPIMLPSRAEIDLFFRHLNRKFASLSPRGYVFRLPTEAEWEYAHKANSTDPDDPYVYKGGQYEKFCKAHPEKTPGWHWGEIEPLLKAKGIKENEYTIAPKVGTRLANKWGIQDMNDCGYELMLDTIDRSIDAPKWHWHLLNVDNKCFAYQPFEMDPLREFAGESARSVTWGRFNGVELLRRPWGEPKHEPVSVALRVCLGPDLIAEKKAKK